MTITIVVMGLPTEVSLSDLAITFDSLFECDDIGSFRVRDVPSHPYSSKRQVALDFESNFDAFPAQSMLDGHEFVLRDETYRVKARITYDKIYLPQDDKIPLKSIAHSVKNKLKSDVRKISNDIEEKHHHSKCHYDDKIRLQSFLEAECRMLDHMSASGEIPTTSRQPRVVPTSRDPPQQPTARYLLTMQTPPDACSHCQRPGHQTRTCREYIKLPTRERRDIARKQRWCFSCLAPHSQKRCQHVVRCPFCRDAHHRLLCGSQQGQQPGMTAHPTAASPRDSQQVPNDIDRKYNSRCYEDKIRLHSVPNDFDRKRHHSKSHSYHEETEVRWVPNDIERKHHSLKYYYDDKQYQSDRSNYEHHRKHEKCERSSRKMRKLDSIDSKYHHTFEDVPSHSTKVSCRDKRRMESTERRDEYTPKEDPASPSTQMSREECEDSPLKRSISNEKYLEKDKGVMDDICLKVPVNKLYSTIDEVLLDGILDSII